MKLQNLSYNQGIILAFVIGFIVRIIPEILSFPYPIGWDTIFYAYRISDGVLFGYWNSPFSTWLLYGIMIFLGNLTQLSPFFLLKILAPLLFGGCAAGIYFVAWKKLSWSITKCLLTSSIFVFQLSALTLSWHFYRNIFGVMILLFSIPLINCKIGWKGTGALAGLSLLIIWGHELAAVSLFAIVFGILTMSFYKKEKICYNLFIAIIPALIFFFGRFLWSSFFSSPPPNNLVWLQDSVLVHPNGLFFLTNYLTVNTTIESYSSYFELFYHVFSLFALLYALILPLVVVGRFKDRVFTFWTLILLAGSFGCLIVPFAALLLWGRWMLMLIFPFTFFVVNGLCKLRKQSISCSKLFPWFKLTRKFALGLITLSFIVGALFMSWPLVDGKYGIIGWDGTFTYVPSTMQTNSVPLQDTEGTIKAFEWLNDNMDDNSLLLAHDVFEFWTLLYLNPNHDAYIFDWDLDAASTLALANDFDSAYFVWWNEDIGWYNMRVSDTWDPVFNSDRVSVYQIF